MTTEEPKSLPRPIATNAALLNLPHLSDGELGLIVTPEKSTLPNRLHCEDTTQKLPPGVLTLDEHLPTPLRQDVYPEKVDLIPTKLSSISSDPTLDVTPEKSSTVLKKGNSTRSKVLGASNTAGKNTHQFRVRFDVPELSQQSDESTTSDITPSAEGQENAGQSNQERILQEPFKKRAALYVQRNPLAEITCDSSPQETSENTTGSETLISTESDNSSGSFFNKISQYIEENEPKVATSNASGKVFHGKATVIPQLPEVKLKSVKKVVTKPAVRQSTKGLKSKIINVVPEENRPPPRSAIDEVTRPKNRAMAEPVAEKKSFLKKKSGLHRHEHSIRYDPDVLTDANPLGGPTYNSTLSLGQELQELRVTEFDAKEAVKKKMEGSERLRNYIAEKTAGATNISPDEKLYQNLVSVDVEPGDIVTSNSMKWKRAKPRPYKPKKSKYGEPDIWETYNPEELYYADLMMDFESMKPPVPPLEPVPLKEMMWADKHEQLWSGAWGWEL